MRFARAGYGRTDLGLIGHARGVAMPGRIVYGIMAVLGLSLISVQPQVHIDTGPSEFGSETPGMTGNRSVMASHNMRHGFQESGRQG